MTRPMTRPKTATALPRDANSKRVQCGCPLSSSADADRMRLSPEVLCHGLELEVQQSHSPKLRLHTECIREQGGVQAVRKLERLAAPSINATKSCSITHQCYWLATG